MKFYTIIICIFSTFTYSQSTYTMPIYPSCEESLDNNELKNCFNEKISSVFKNGFDRNLIEQFKILNFKEIEVYFSINTDGKIIDLKLPNNSNRFINSYFINKIKDINENINIIPAKINDVPTKILSKVILDTNI